MWLGPQSAFLTSTHRHKFLPSGNLANSRIYIALRCFFDAERKIGWQSSRLREKAINPSPSKVIGQKNPALAKIRIMPGRACSFSTWLAVGFAEDPSQLYREAMQAV